MNYPHFTQTAYNCTLYSPQLNFVLKHTNAVAIGAKLEFQHFIYVIYI